MWNIIEGTHVLTIMFFAGTIWMIDLRMMGIAFKNMPLSKLSDRVLPITIISLLAMVITGAIAFIGRDPLMYYHNIWFRLKMVFLVAAMINILWFHYRVQKSDGRGMYPPMSDLLPVKRTHGFAALIALSFVLLVSFVISGVDVRDGRRPHRAVHRRRGCPVHVDPQSPAWTAAGRETVRRSFDAGLVPGHHLRSLHRL
jgi:hypothetical protein